MNNTIFPLVLGLRKIVAVGDISNLANSPDIPFPCFWRLSTLYPYALFPDIARSGSCRGEKRVLADGRRRNE